MIGAAGKPRSGSSRSRRVAHLPRALCMSAVVIGTAVLRGCDRDQSAERGQMDTSSAAGGRLGSGLPSAAARDTIAAVQIQWSVAEILDRLRADGMSGRLQGEIRQPFLAVPGVLVTLPGAEVQVYLYGDAGAAGRDVARLDTARVSPPNMMITWTARPSLIWHNNLVAIVLTRNEQLRARIRRSLRPGAHESAPAQP